MNEISGYYLKAGKWLEYVLAPIALAKFVTAVWFRSWLELWNPFDRLLGALVIPIYVFQLVLQGLVLYNVLRSWQDFPIKTMKNAENQGNLLFLMVALFQEVGIVSIFFVVSFALYLTIIWTLAIKSWSESKDIFSNLDRHFFNLVFIDLFVLGQLCLVCL